MAGIDLRLPKPLDCANIAKEWPRWKQSFGVYLRASGKMSESEENKIANFLWHIGPRGVEIFNSLFPDLANSNNLFGYPTTQEEEEEPEYENASETVPEVPQLAAIIKAFDDYCIPRKNIAMETFKFNTIQQKEGESFGGFETELRTQAQFCEFKCQQCQAPYLDRMLRDRIIVAIQDKDLQLKLLNRSDDPLSKVIDLCKVHEAASENKRILEKKTEPVEVKVLEKPAEEEKEQVAAISEKNASVAESRSPRTTDVIVQPETPNALCVMVRVTLAKCVAVVLERKAVLRIDKRSSPRNRQLIRSTGVTRVSVLVLVLMQSFMMLKKALISLE